MMNAHRGNSILSDIGAFQRGENVQEQVKKKIMYGERYVCQNENVELLNIFIVIIILWFDLSQNKTTMCIFKNVV